MPPPDEPGTPGGAVVYWHVNDVPAALASLVSRGATEFQPPTDRGEGFVTAAVIDPFDNILGVMYNPHYVEIGSRTTQRMSAGGRSLWRVARLLILIGS